MPGKRSFCEGFTLIEMMVVMLLISIILAVAIPNFEGGILQDPIKKTSRWMINTARAMRAQALQSQKRQTLVIDLDNNRMWVVNETMDDEAQHNAMKKAFRMPSDIKIVDVQFPEKDRIISGNAEINYYPSGYSDRTLIHMEDDDARRYTFLVEPLLPKVKFLEQWLSF